MFTNKKGAALLQVLLVTAVLAGLATMLLRVSMTRSAAARQTRREVSAQMLIETCMAEVNAMWSLKEPEIFQRDMQSCLMNCNATTTKVSDCKTINGTRNWTREYTCTVQPFGTADTYTVTASFVGSATNINDFTQDNTTGQCKLTFTVAGPDL